MTTLHKSTKVVSFSLNNEPQIQEKLFREEFLPTLCDMTYDEYRGMVNDTLKKNLREVFFLGQYGSLLHQRNLRRIKEFIDSLPPFGLPGNLLFSSNENGPWFSRDDLSDIKAILREHLLDGIKFAVSVPLNFIVTQSQQETLLRITQWNSPEENIYIRILNPDAFFYFVRLSAREDVDPLCVDEFEEKLKTEDKEEEDEYTADDVDLDICLGRPIKDRPAPRPGMVKVSIPFAGFYESIITYVMERYDEYIREGIVDERKEAKDKTLLPEWAGAKILLNLERVCVTWIDKFKDMIYSYSGGIEIHPSFAELDRPREYNFARDILCCWIDKEEVKQLLDYIDKHDKCKEDMQREIKEMTTARSGYIPFYKEADFCPLNDDCPACFYEAIFNAILPDDAESRIGWDWFDDTEWNQLFDYEYPHEQTQQ